MRVSNFFENAACVSALSARASRLSTDNIDPTKSLAERHMGIWLPELVPDVRKFRFEMYFNRGLLTFKGASKVLRATGHICAARA